MKSVIPFILISLMILQACKKTKTNAEPKIEVDSIIGTWKIEAATFGVAEEFNGDGIYSTDFFKENNSTVEGNLQFNADGTIAITKYYWGAFNGADKTILVCTGMPAHGYSGYTGKWDKINGLYRITLNVAAPDWLPIITFQLNSATNKISSLGQKVRLQKGQVIYDNTIQFVYVR